MREKMETQLLSRNAKTHPIQRVTTMGTSTHGGPMVVDLLSSLWALVAVTQWPGETLVTLLEARDGTQELAGKRWFKIHALQFLVTY
jgi:hypothetical protein